MLIRLGAWGRALAQTSPWTNGYGLARTLLALGTLGTLLFSPTDALFRPAVGPQAIIFCEGPSRFSLFCLGPDDSLGALKWLAIVCLLVIASGWRPRWTALPHWWIAFSLQGSATMLDGGDQITAVLTILLLPLALTDPRRWHWERPPRSNEPPVTASQELARIIGHMTWWLIRIQVAGVYFHASIAKFGVEEWADGTAYYYWLVDPLISTPEWLKSILLPVVSNAGGVALLTWGPMVLELVLAAGLLLPRRTWPALLTAGIAFHVSIAIMMGLISFSFAMVAALLLFLRPIDQPIEWLHDRVTAQRSNPSPTTSAQPVAPT